MRKLFYTSTLLALFVLTGCPVDKMAKMASDQGLNIVPNPLELHGDSVKFTADITLPVKMLKKSTIYTANFVYKYGDQEMAVGSVDFTLEDYPNSDVTQPRVSKSFSFAYTDAMKNGTLEVRGVAKDTRKDKQVEAAALPVADGIITTSRLVRPVYFPAYADHGYNNQEEIIPTNISFFFDQGSSVLKYSERRSERGKEFEAFIAEKNVTRTVTITGTHSPEGTERINSKLSADRASVIEKYYQSQMKKYDYKGMADSISFVLKPIVDDWSKFKTALSEYDGITSDQKSEYLNIVNGPGVFEDKEKALQKLSTYKKVFKDVYPGLRAAKTEILTVKEKKTDAEIAVLAKGIADGTASQDTLSTEELLYAASLTPSLAEKEAIYKAAIKKDDSWVAHANLAATYVAMAMEDPSKSSAMAASAETQVDLANGKNPSAAAYVTAASVYLMQGNMDKASDALSKAASMNPTPENANGLKGVKGAIEIRKGAYSDATSSLSGATETADNLFNKGLAYLLNESNDNAISAFNDAIALQSDYALAYYGIALANARKGDGGKVAENLQKAISNDAALKEVAINDLEFKSFAADAAFMNAIK
jgi:tetratricopeptide (TPR) repeat protein/outer membrane protein OmpA-like peptidoglycan-associated protein